VNFAENLAERCQRRRHPCKSRCRLPTRVRRPRSDVCRLSPSAACARSRATLSQNPGNTFRA
jgi:hypothetical protein